MMSDQSIQDSAKETNLADIGAMRSLVSYLESEIEKGNTHVMLDGETRKVLRTLATRSSQKRPNESALGTTPKPSPAKSNSHTGDDAGNIHFPALISTPSSLSKSERLVQLEQQVRGWLNGDFPKSLRQTMVFSSGDPDSKLMLIGEAPGHEEEKALHPFVGPAGKKLDQILSAMGLKREDTYTTNILKFRPTTPRQTTNNRKPSDEEVAAFIPVIREEIRIVQPECIVAMGATALEALLDTKSTVSSMRGSWHEFEGIPLRVTYHPSYLLQSGESLSVKRMLWEDMLTVMEKIGIEPTAKQRAYFLPNS